MKPASHYHLPTEPGRWRALALAGLVHGLLFGLLWFGVRWQNETPATVEAEIWSTRPIEAAPRPQPAPPPPRPEPAPPQPQRPVEPVKEIPKPVPAQVPDPDIVLEQEKKRRLEEERQEQARLERERKEEQQKKEREAQAQKEAELKKEAQLKREKEEKERQERERKEAEAKKEKEKAEAQAKLEAQRKQEQARAAAEEKRRQEAAEAKAAEERHQQFLDRMRNQATGSGGSGQAAQAIGTRADPTYAGLVASRIKSHTTFHVPDNLNGNPPVDYQVDLLPDGSVRSLRKLRSSGVPGFDEAVRRAIERSQPFPADRSGKVPASITVSHRPKDN